MNTTLCDDCKNEIPNGELIVLKKDSVVSADEKFPKEDVELCSLECLGTVIANYMDA